MNYIYIARRKLAEIRTLWALSDQSFVGEHIDERMQNAFINKVTAQVRKKITQAQGNQLTPAAQNIIIG
jgi:hypothetical protein